VKRIDVLPDDVLLGIFDFYMIMYPSYGDKTDTEAWQSLVHVCRRWRSLVFLSPRRLNLRLFCTPETPARNTLDVWPTLPLIIKGTVLSSTDSDNVIAALEQSNRICQVKLRGLGRQEVLAAMQVTFPELTELLLVSRDDTMPVIPDSFLDGSAPRLRHFASCGIPFPGLPKLLLSTTNLVYLWLSDIPYSGYIPPEAMVAPLCALSSLRTLSLEFRSTQPCPDWRSQSLSPPKRSILPALDEFHFKGATEYLEEFVTLIDAPQLDYMDINFFNQIDFDCRCPRLARFINCKPTFTALHAAHVQFSDSNASLKLRYRTYNSYHLLINISCREQDWQLSNIGQLCNAHEPLQPLSGVEDLYIEHRHFPVDWKNDIIENSLWLELLIPFTAVKNLYLSTEFALGIAVSLTELVGGRITEVLPSLQNIFVEGLEPLGPFQENIGQFVTARQLSGHSVAISYWDEFARYEEDRKRRSRRKTKEERKAHCHVCTLP
jgi:hypothetical protein